MTLNANKIKYGLLLGVLGDTIGYGNGKTEFNNGNEFSIDNYGDKFEQLGAEYSNELVFNFIFDGGYHTHPKPDAIASDDSAMLIANIKALILWNSDDVEILMSFIRSEYLKLIGSKDALEKFEQRQGGGRTTINYLKKLQNGYDYKEYEYDTRAGGSGGSMRAMAFGTYLWKPEQRLLLIETVIETTTITHPNAIAYLGAIAVALFTSYAIQGLAPEQWHIQMMDVMESDVINEYIQETREKTFPHFLKDKKLFINKWKDYIEERFTEHNSYKKSMIMKYPSKRSAFYNKFSSKKKEMYPGAGGDDSAIIAYDCLVACEGSWDKVVNYSMLHVGDSDTTGTICAYLYGSYYCGESVEGANVYDIMVNNMTDYKDECIELSSTLHQILNRK
jgi:ADP-ribosylarginine hydrolase